MPGQRNTQLAQANGSFGGPKDSIISADQSRGVKPHAHSELGTTEKLAYSESGANESQPDRGIRQSIRGSVVSDGYKSTISV
jgi:hypothetical protein